MHERKYRINVFVDSVRMMIVVRPIGRAPIVEVLQRLFMASASLETPWLFSRVIDIRRFEGHITLEHLNAVSTGFADLAGGQTYDTSVAVVTFDPLSYLKHHSPSSLMPNETTCSFSDYHSAIGWVLANDKIAYLGILQNRAPGQAKAAPPQITFA